MSADTYPTVWVVAFILAMTWGATMTCLCIWLLEVNSTIRRKKVGTVQHPGHIEGDKWRDAEWVATLRAQGIEVLP